jgi:glutamine cyclotransferase
MRVLALVSALLLALSGSAFGALTPDVAVASSAAVSPAASASPVAGPVPYLAWEVVSRRPHDDAAFTQGLVLAPDGRLFESTGLYGSSGVREVDPRSGQVWRSRALPDDQFGEGLALVDEELVQLTWKAGLARRFDAATFEVVGRHRYEGQGWGLCHDGQRLVMSDGSDRLTFRDPVTFEVLGSVAVTAGGQPLTRLNELECVDDEVWANVWLTDVIARIDPADGLVTGMLDLATVIEPHPLKGDGAAVLNGIAYDGAADTFLVTGKRWPQLIEIRVSR